MTALLEVRGVSKRFGGVHAVKDVSFSVRKGTVKALIGPNGAGKTTLFNLVSGVVAPDAGEVRFRGEAIQGRPPHRVAALGLSRTFQHIRLFAGMTALENVMVGRHLRARAGFVAGMLHLPWTRREEREIEARAREALDFLGIPELADAEATSLSYGQQRAVELARALASDPELLLLDEPAAGLNMKETAALGRLARRIVERGTTVVMVEHDMDLVMNVTERIVVMEFGRLLMSGTPREVQADSAVRSAYLGFETEEVSA